MKNCKTCQHFREDHFVYDGFDGICLLHSNAFDSKDKQSQKAMAKDRDGFDADFWVSDSFGCVAHSLSSNNQDEADFVEGAA